MRRIILAPAVLISGLVLCGCPDDSRTVFVTEGSNAEAPAATPTPAPATPPADAPAAPMPSGPAPNPPPPPPPPLVGYFADATEHAGIDFVHRHGEPLNHFYAQAGQAWGDYDGDGWLDLYLSNGNGPNILYRNLGDGTFEESPLSDQVAVPWIRSGGAQFIDYDNDGWQDLYVINWGPDRLFHNDGGTGFTDVTATAGLGSEGAGMTASFADYDNDGDLDLYVCNWLNQDFTTIPEQTIDAFYRNEGDGTFTDITATLGNGTTGVGFAAGFFDYDEDGDLDIYVVVDKGYEGPDQTPINRNTLYRNDGPDGMGGWIFTERAIAAGVDARVYSMGLGISDYDNDRDLDMVFSSGPPSVNLYRNESDGTFTDVSEDANVWYTGNPGDPWAWGWRLFFADLDLDGWQDIFTAMSGTQSNFIYFNQGDGTFVHRTADLGDGLSEYTTCVAYADYDRDGRVDYAIGNYRGRYRLFRNQGDGTTPNWLSVRLTGGGPVNRDAVGSIVRVRRTDGLVMTQQIVTGAGNDLALHFGLADSDVDTVTVTWPNGVVETFSSVTRNQEFTTTYPTP